MLSVHLMEQWFTLSDPGKDEAFLDTPLYREFAQLEEFGRVPDESTILRFRRQLEKHKLSEYILIERGLLLNASTVVDATLIAEQMYFGIKAHIGAHAESGLVHTVRGTSDNVSEVVEGNSLLYGEETVAFGDAGYQGIEKCPDSKAEVIWHVAMRPGEIRALDKDNAAHALHDKAEKIKAGIWAKVKHPFRVIERQFGYVKVRYRGLKNNTAQLLRLFALSNLWMVRGKLMVAQA